MSKLIKKIDKVQRFELLEERLGISISNVGAVVVNDGTAYDPAYWVKVTAEVIAIDGGNVKDIFQINITATDSQGNGLGASHKTFYESFFGIDILDLLFEVYTTDVEAVKIFPVKR